MPYFVKTFWVLGGLRKVWRVRVMMNASLGFCTKLRLWYNPNYHRDYWKIYKKKTKQISLTVSFEEYKMWKQAASRQGRRGVGAQIKAEALAYREQEYLPELDTQNYLTELIRILRGIGNNLNQIAHHSNAMGRAMSHGKGYEGKGRD